MRCLLFVSHICSSLAHSNFRYRLYFAKYITSTTFALSLYST